MAESALDTALSIVRGPDVPAHDFTAIHTADTAALRGELARALTITAQSLAYLAAIWQELESRGEDLSDLRTGLGVYLPLIASGRLDPATVVHFAGRRALLARLAMLPISEQRRLTAGDPIHVVVPDNRGGLIEESLPLTRIDGRYLATVFDEGRIRSASEQRQIIEAKRAKRRPYVDVRPKPTKLKVNQADGTFKVGQHQLAPEDFAAALAILAAPQDVSTDTARHFPIRLDLPEYEYEFIKELATRSKLSMAEVVLGLLRNTGAVKPPPA